ncbi:TPA: hypothetical protein QFG33_002633 [Enterococcus faecium]
MVLSKTLIVFTFIILIILVLFISFVAKYQNDKTYETFKETRIKKAEAEKNPKTTELHIQVEITEALQEKEIKLTSYKQEQDISKEDQAYNTENANNPKSFNNK